MSASHHAADNVQHLYEGDQSKLYSGVMQHHTDVASPESRAQVKRIWKIFWVLLVVTVIEVIMGMFYSHHMPKALVAFIFLALTLLKAGYIVSVFMHLGDEKKNFLITVLIPLTLFIWFIIAFLSDGFFWLHMNKTSPTRDKQNTEQVQQSNGN